MSLFILGILLVSCPDFKTACNQHDIDYSKLGLPKAVSDLRFYKAMAQACVQTFGKNVPALTGCLAIADIYFIAVIIGGSNAYNQAQSLAHNLKAAKERERGMCYPNDVFVQGSGNTYYIAIDW